MGELQIQPKYFNRFLAVNDKDNMIENKDSIKKLEVDFKPVEFILEDKRYESLKKLKGVKVNVQKNGTVLKTYVPPMVTYSSFTENHRILKPLIATNKRIAFVVGSGCDNGISGLDRISELLKSGDYTPGEVASIWIEDFMYSEPSPTVKKLAQLSRGDDHILIITTNVSGHFKIANSNPKRTICMVSNPLKKDGHDTVKITMMGRERGRNILQIKDLLKDRDIMIYLGIGLRWPVDQFIRCCDRAVIVYLSRSDYDLKKKWKGSPYTKIVDHIESVFHNIDPEELIDERNNGIAS